MAFGRLPRSQTSQAPTMTGDTIAARKKTGFSVPVRDWLREDAPSLAGQRGLRGWSQVIRRSKGGNRFLAFITDGFGGHGGIACDRCRANIRCGQL